MASPTQAATGRPRLPAARSVIVVGAGVGGLSAAIRLACAGIQVRLVEAADGPGGKMRPAIVDGVGIDAGPTVFTMRWAFDELFELAGDRFEDRVRLAPLQVLARHAWRDGSRLDLHADPERTLEEITRFAGAREAARFQAFRSQARQVLATLEPTYIRAPRPSFTGMVRDLGPRGLSVLAGLGPFATLAGNLSRRFRDPRLRQLFARYATYCGASPWVAPATLMLIAQVEMNGVWRIDGGMGALARALEALAQRCGVVLRYGARCRRILKEAGRARGIELEDGERIRADAVVFNGDVHALACGLLGPDVRGAAEPVPLAARSLSAVTWAIRGRPRGFPLEHHNVFFDDDYASEFRDIFRHRRLPRRGTVYVCAQDRGGPPSGLSGEFSQGPSPLDAALMSKGHDAAERLLCLVNAPALGDRGGPSELEIDECEARSFELLRACGLMLEPEPSATLRTSPVAFERQFPATGGALYGQAMNGWMATFRRPPAQTRLPGLFLSGGSAHPGAGVPMATLSGRWAAEAAMAHLASIRQWHPAATSGGTSTPSATTAGTG